MKDDSERDYVAPAESLPQICTAEIEVANVKFSKAANLGIDFQNKIDAWSKMEFTFRQQIQRLKSLKSPSKGGRPALRGRKDLKTLVYSMREKLD
jgi:hypothetical protein